MSAICVRRGRERRESWPRQYSLPFIAAINRHYDYHTQYVDIFTKWGARFISKYQNRPLPSTSCYFSRLSNVLIPRPVSCMVIVVSVGLPGVQGFYRFYTHPFIYYLHKSTSTYVYAHFNQVYILVSFAKLGIGRSRNICRYAGARARATVAGYAWYLQCRYCVDTV